VKIWGSIRSPSWIADLRRKKRAISEGGEGPEEKKGIVSGFTTKSVGQGCRGEGRVCFPCSRKEVPGEEESRVGIMSRREQHRKSPSAMRLVIGGRGYY